MIVGADGASDATVVRNASALYASYDLKRIYYSAFSPIPDSSRLLPVKAAPLVREHRLYQADWLYRFYGFGIEEVTAARADGMLDLDLDPKLAWALKNRHRFPVDVNRADRELLLRVPGLGARAVDKIVVARRHTTLRLEDVGRLTSGLKRARPFLIAADHHPGGDLDRTGLRDTLVEPPEQLSLFA